MPESEISPPLNHECPVGHLTHLDLNKISLIRDSVIGPDLQTLQFFSLGSHFVLGVSASGFSDQMLAYRLVNNGDVVAFKMGRRQGARRAHI